jgi:hypothetical protein
MNSFYRWIAILSCVLGCGIVYSAIWNSYFGNYTQKMQWPLCHWVGTLSGTEQAVLVVITPFASAIIGGLVVAVVILGIAGAIWEATIGRLFR